MGNRGKMGEASCELVIHSDLSIVEIRHCGILGVADAYGVRGEVARIMAEKEIRLVLVDVRGARVSASTMELFDFHATEPRSLPSGTKFALVYSPAAWDPDSVAFAESVSANRGLNKRSFMDRAEAIRWLTDSEEESP